MFLAKRRNFLLNQRPIENSIKSRKSKAETSIGEQGYEPYNMSYEHQNNGNF